MKYSNALSQSSNLNSKSYLPINILSYQSVPYNYDKPCMIQTTMRLNKSNTESGMRKTLKNTTSFVI